MVEEQEELQIGIGTEEAISLKPANVKIMRVEVIETPAKKAKKIVCYSKHPDNPDLIQISSIKFENKGKLEIAGLWLNLDSKKLIRKGSALAVFLQNLGCKVISDLTNKEIPTIQDDKGYLVFKAY